MKIVFANPPWPHESDPLLWGVRAGSRWPHFQKRRAGDMLPGYVPFPFFLSIAAAVARERGHDVLLLDGVAGNMGLDVFFEKISCYGPDLIFCETSTPSLDWDISVWVGLRPRNSGVLLCAGGTHCRDSGAALVDKGFLDFWIHGEYDFAVTELAEALEQNAGLNKISGLVCKAYKSGDTAQVTEPDFLPMPLYEQLPVAAYADPVCGLPAPSAYSWLSRGCPFRCTFCVWPQLLYGNRRYRPRKIDSALNEVEILIDKYGCESFYFDDDTANIGEARMEELAGKILSRGLSEYPWSMMARADCMTPRMIEALAKAGMYSVKYGIESVAPRLINACNKATKLDALRSAVSLTRAAGIKMHLTFTFGIPGETVETINETVDFLLDTCPETAQFSICTPFPGTEFHDECERNGWLTTNDWRNYLGSGKAVVTTPWLDAEKLEEAYGDAVKRWERFCEQRLEARRHVLVKRLRESVGSGKKWTLIGDTEFAGFISASLSRNCYKKQENNLLLTARSPSPSGRGLGVRVGEAISLSGDELLSGAYVEQPGPGVVVVIVSRHDEEKLWRRLKRENPELAAEAIRLYYG